MTSIWLLTNSHQSSALYFSKSEQVGERNHLTPIYLRGNSSLDIHIGLWGSCRSIESPSNQ